MHRRTITTPALAAGLVATAALAVAAPALAGAGVFRAAGPVEELTAGENSVLLPDGAAARVQYVATADGRTRVTLHLTGFAPHHTYGAHAHVEACDPGGLEGGKHFQRVPVAAGGAVDAHNEVWLDVTTNASGNGHASSVHDWQIEPGRGPRSVIIHAEQTSTGTGDKPAGTAGPKLACLAAQPF